MPGQEASSRSVGPEISGARAAQRVRTVPLYVKARGAGFAVLRALLVGAGTMPSPEDGQSARYHRSEEPNANGEFGRGGGAVPAGLASP
jgi:hypothetical protein